MCFYLFSITIYLLFLFTKCNSQLLLLISLVSITHKSAQFLLILLLYLLLLQPPAPNTAKPHPRVRNLLHLLDLRRQKFPEHPTNPLHSQTLVSAARESKTHSVIIYNKTHAFYLFANAQRIFMLIANC